MEVSKLMEDMEEGRCKCENCIYFFESENLKLRIAAVNGVRSATEIKMLDTCGMCRRKAPRSAETGWANVFPLVTPDCWCGEFELAP